MKRNEKVVDFGVDEKQFARIAPYVEKIAQADGICKVVILPEAYMKQKYIDDSARFNTFDTIPSSTVITSESHVLYPQLRARGLNCGMALVGTDMGFSECNASMAIEIVKELAKKPWDYIIRRLQARLPSRSVNGELKDLFLRFYNEGAAAAIDYFKLDDYAKDILPAFPSKGRMKVTHPATHLSGDHERYLCGLGNLSHFGRGFSGNHYLEIQRVQRLTDTKQARICGLFEDQMVVMYHTGGSRLFGFLPESLRQKLERPKLVPISDSTEDFEIILNAVAWAMNFSWAVRVASFAAIKSAIKKYFPIAKIWLLTDNPHNSIDYEVIDGDEYFVYRHNATKLQESTPTILAGSYDHPSYLVFPLQNASKSINTIDHGLGTTIEQDRANGRNYETNAIVQTFRQKPRWLALERDQRAVWRSEEALQVVKLHRQAGIASAIAELVPVVNYKG